MIWGARFVGRRVMGLPPVEISGAGAGALSLGAQFPALLGGCAP